jgi:hypothetical protein
MLITHLPCSIFNIFQFISSIQPWLMVAGPACVQWSGRCSNAVRVNLNCRCWSLPYRTHNRPAGNIVPRWNQDRRCWAVTCGIKVRVISPTEVFLAMYYIHLWVLLHATRSTHLLLLFIIIIIFFSHNSQVSNHILLPFLLLLLATPSPFRSCL